ncbi:hypothetical protein [Rhodopirellula halodulae]|uniref:hypothetical protein n=1 Tax=Rhodopirellula halodulae TaxID=2894198 RepID=UPI001E2E41B1|nr:hypothetical protein [Rhodopirellula sp. JC737]MCC9656717.1 hypothetical protein [Rhodopirellula sp. JC737]
MDNHAIHTEPPNTRLANGDRFFGGPVIAAVLFTEFKMKPLRLTLILLSVFCAADLAYSEDHPNHMVGLIDGQTLIGLKRIDKTNDYIVTLVTDAEADIERDVASLDIPKLFAKHPQVAERGTAVLTAFRTSLAEKESDIPRGAKLGQPKLHVSPTAGKLHKVHHVGRDYILLESSDAEQPRKFAVNSRLIREIRWYSGPGFGASVRHLRENNTEQ